MRRRAPLLIACMLVQATSGFVAPTKKAWRALRVADGGAEHAALPVGTASLHAGSVAAEPAAAKATPAPAAPAPKAEAPPAATTLEGDAAEHAIPSPTTLDPNAFAGAAALAAGAVGLGVDVELATVAAGAAAVVSALDEESSVGQLTRSLGRLALSTFEGAKRFDAEVGVTDAIKGKALALAIDATEAAADAPAKLRKPARDEPKTLYTPLWQPPKDGAPVGAGEPAWAHKAEQRREELAALAAAKAAADEAARLAAVAAIPVTSREILAAREESGAVATLGRLAGRWLWRRDARKKAMKAEEKQRS
jgi:hypothetical protein